MMTAMPRRCPREKRGGRKGRASRAAFQAPPTFLVPFALGPKKSKAVDAWQIKDDPITVVMYNRFHTGAGQRWTFPADGPTDEQIKAVIDTTLKTIRDQSFR